MLRVLLILLLLFPVAVRADAASDLGPQTNNAPAGSTQSVSPNQSSSLLQPASGTSSPLQSADATRGGASQSSATQNLQQTGSSDQIKLMISGEADQPHNVSGGGPDLSFLLYIFLVLVVASAMTGAVLLLQNRQSLAKS